MKSNKTAILISAIATIIFALAACLGHGSGAVFDTCVLLLSCSFLSFYYSLLHRVYRW